MKVWIVLLLANLSGAMVSADERKEASAEDTKAKIELRLGEGKSKVVTVALGQSAREAYNLCKPAKVYAADDPWIGCMAAEGGHYVLFFSAEGTAKQMQGRLDPSRDKLYAVVRYPRNAREDGEFLLPKTMRDKTCGDFVTLKVPLGAGKARVATVAIGMSPRDAMNLFRPASDHSEQESAILFDAIHNGGRYLLIFSVPGDSSAHDPKNKLSQVMYWPGGQDESIFLLPRKNRGEPVPAEYRAILEK